MNAPMGLTDDAVDTIEAAPTNVDIIPHADEIDNDVNTLDETNDHTADSHMVDDGDSHFDPLDTNENVDSVDDDFPPSPHTGRVDTSGFDADLDHVLEHPDTDLPDFRSPFSRLHIDEHPEGDLGEADEETETKEEQMREDIIGAVRGEELDEATSGLESDVFSARLSGLAALLRDAMSEREVLSTRNASLQLRILAHETRPSPSPDSLASAHRQVWWVE